MNLSANSAAPRDTGKGLALPGLIVGLLTGFAARLRSTGTQGKNSGVLGVKRTSWILAILWMTRSS